MKEKQNKRISLAWKKCALLVACLSLIALCVFAVIKFSTNNHTSNNQNSATDTNGKHHAPVLYMDWNGISVSPKLYKELSNANDFDNLDISVSIWYSIPDDYVYNGKDFDEYFLELNEAKTFLSKAKYLVAEGDLLKYGELLYTDGTPNGTKWKKTRYEKILDYYGEEFLNTYIIDGEFLKDKLVHDIENAETKVESLKITIEDGKEALRVSSINKGLEVFKKVNQNAFVKEEQIYLTLTKNELSNLKIENKEKYKFYLASEQ